MKKLLYLILIGMLITSPVYGADLWLEGTGAQAVAGADSPADLDDLIQDYITNPLDRLTDAYRSDAVCLYASASTLTVSIGCVVCEDSSSVHRMRENTSATTVTWSNLDTGSEAASTYYYVYANSDADATVFTVTISASSSAPTGVTYYKKIGWFYNDSSSDIVYVGNTNTGASGNAVKVSATDTISTTSATYGDMDDMVVYFVSHGRPVEIVGKAMVSNGGVNETVIGIIDVDGTDKTASESVARGGDVVRTGGADATLICVWLEDLTAGTHTIKYQWKKGSSDTAYADNRVLKIVEH